jgi:flagellar basal-body rod protein FlgC
MDFITALNVSASGMDVQRTRLKIIANNLANIETTRTPEGGPYRRQMVVMGSRGPDSPFARMLDNTEARMAKIEEIVEDQQPFRQEYNPSHPDADEAGYVLKPNVDLIVENTNLLMATRAFEANLAAIRATREMVVKSLEIGR